MKTFDSFSDSLLLEVLSSSGDAVAVYSTPGLQIRFANDGMLAIWGKDRDIIGKSFETAIPELVGQPFTALLKQVWQTGITYTGRNESAELIVRGQLQKFFFDYEYKPLKDDQGNVICILHTAIDVTERLNAESMVKDKEKKEAQLLKELETSYKDLTQVNLELSLINKTLDDSMKMLAESQTYLRSIMDKAPIGICILKGPDLVIEMANEAILKTWGRTAEEVLGRPHHIARPELSGQAINQWLDEVLVTGITKVNNEIGVMLKDGNGLKHVYVNSIYQAIRNQSGEIIGIVVILEEITEKIKQRREANRVQDMFNLAVTAGEMGTFFYDPKLNVFSANDTLKNWFGLGPDQYLGLQLALDTIHPDDRPVVVKKITDALVYENGGQYEAEYTIIHPETGIPRVVKAKGRAFFDHRQQATSLNGTLIDITEPKKEEQRKNDFIAMVSHELKTPLASMKLYLQLLQRDKKLQSDLFASGTLSKASRQVNKMIEMINSFLNISRLEAGKLTINKKEFNIGDLMMEIEEETITTISSHTITYDCTNIMVNADREKISQVIHNILSNAVKYSANKTTITVNCTNGDGYAVVSVKDEGIGVKREDQGRLFERYYRVNADHGDAVSGFGIGLFLSSEIIALHKGSIWVESEAGKGATFYFTIPMADS